MTCFDIWLNICIWVHFNDIVLKFLCFRNARNKSDETKDLIKFQDETFTKKLGEQVRVYDIMNFILLKFNTAVM